LGAKEPGAVDGMEAEPVQRGSVAHVIQKRAGHQQLGILGDKTAARSRALSATA
jgi:hypothetical protein